MSSGTIEEINLLKENTLKKNKEYIIYKMVYKPNENKEQKKKNERIERKIWNVLELHENKEEIMKELKQKEFFYDEKEYIGDVLRIFSKDFVKNNKRTCRIIYKNKKYELKEYLEEIDNNYTSTTLARNAFSVRPASSA